MADPLEILPVTGIGDITPGADLADLMVAAAPWLRDGDILIVTSKIVSKAEGQLVEVPVEGPEREAARAAILAAETARPVARRGTTHIVQTHHGFVMASAGIDASNVDHAYLVLLPKDPDASARALRAALRERHGLDVAVVISDTMGRPWRTGLTDVALGVAGLDPIRDYRGLIDAYGNDLHITQMAIADELCAAADLVKGKSDQVPVAVVRGYLEPPVGPDGPGAAAMVRDAAHDLFSLGTAEARAAGLRAATSIVDEAFATAPPDSDGYPSQDAWEAIDRALSSFGSQDAAFALVETGPESPHGTIACVACRVTGDAFAAGGDLHRLRCALTAEGLATQWLATHWLPAPLGVLAVGRPRRRETG